MSKKRIKENTITQPSGLGSYIDFNFPLKPKEDVVNSRQKNKQDFGFGKFFLLILAAVTSLSECLRSGIKKRI